MIIQSDKLGNLKSLRTDDSTACRRFGTDDDLEIAGRSPFRQDADTKIALAKAFRQLMFKTQVVSSPINALIRNRASHTIEVVSLATMVADLLGLNVDLVRAIALGHDTGHVPFGHAGEEFLTEKLGKIFRHEVFGVVRAQKIERLGQGLNLTHQTLAGILYHSRGSGELTIAAQMSAEATVVMYADKISYILSDFNDLVKRCLLSEDETRDVRALMNELGRDQRERSIRLILAFCRESVVAGRVRFEKCPEAETFRQIKSLMYRLYDRVNSHGVYEVLERVYEFVTKKVVGVNPAMLIALMNDEDILFLSNKTIFDRSDFNQTSVAEQLPYIRQLDPALSLTEPDLNW